MMKLCKDCKWWRRDVPFFWMTSISKCVAPKSFTEIDLVSGKRVQWMSFAENSRESSRACGKEAKWHEPINTDIPQEKEDE